MRERAKRERELRERTKRERAKRRIAKNKVGKKSKKTFSIFVSPAVKKKKKRKKMAYIISTLLGSPLLIMSVRLSALLIDPNA